MTLYAKYVLSLILICLIVGCAGAAGVVDQALSNLCYELEDDFVTSANSTSRVAQSRIFDPWFKTVECLFETGEVPPTLQETAETEIVPSNGS